MDDLTHFYQVLGLKPGATFEEVKTVYRDLVKVWHPDRFSHDERLRLVAQEKLKEINGAYKMLEAHFFEASIQAETPPTAKSEPATPPLETAAAPVPTSGNKTARLATVILVLVAVAAAGAFFLTKKKPVEKTPTPEEAKPVVVTHPGVASAQYALSFDGSKSQLAIATTGSLTGTFTMECWALSRRPNGPILSSREPNNFSFEILFRQRKRFHIDLGNGSQWLGTNASAGFNFNLNTWYHVACVVTPEDCTVYVNEKKIKVRGLATTNAILYDQDHQMAVGANPRNNDYLDGSIADVRIWNTARSEGQIKAYMNTPLSGNEPDLQGYWPFKEGLGTNTVDSSGHGFTAQLTGNISWSTNLPPQLTLK